MGFVRSVRGSWTGFQAGAHRPPTRTPLDPRAYRPGGPGKPNLQSLAVNVTPLCPGPVGLGSRAVRGPPVRGMCFCVFVVPRTTNPD